MNKSKKYLEFLERLFRYRFVIAALFFVVLVAFEIHGSSISEWTNYIDNSNSGMEEYTFFGQSRAIRTDEWAVNTPMALSQFYNKTGAFPYFSDTIRGTQTDAFIVYGQPVRDISVLFRPFHWGYLFLSQGQGLSFFWIGRFMALFLVTLELSMLITKKNKLLSLAAAVLVTFAPVIQWWFAVNGLVEMLVFGQLAVLIIYHYMNTDRMLKRCIYSIILAICAGGYVLTFYPAWMVPLFYIFLALAIWVIISNYGKGTFTLKDIGPLIVFVALFGGGMAHILSKSLPTIMTVLNTAYPGERFETGRNIFTRFFQYIGNLFFPFNGAGVSGNVCEQAVFFDLFPLGLIFAVITLWKQKKKDILLILLLAVSVFLGLWCVTSWPDWLAKITLLSNVQPERLQSVLGLANIFLLMRSVSLGEIQLKPHIAAVAAVIYSGVITYVSKQVYGEYFTKKYIIVSFVVLISISIWIFIRQNKKSQVIFAACCLVLAFMMGFTVNPVEQGVNAILEQPIVKEIKAITDENDGLWLVEGLGLPHINLPMVVGTPTINSTNVYPYLERWQALDKNDNALEIYNRYAHITINLQKVAESEFVLQGADAFEVNLNISDLYKLNASYILTRNDLTIYTCDEVDFQYVSSFQGLNIYKVVYVTDVGE